jgi:hypothetical protein
MLCALRFLDRRPLCFGPALLLGLLLGACGGRAASQGDDGAINADSGVTADTGASDSVTPEGDLLSPGAVTVTADRTQTSPNTLLKGTVANGKNQRVWLGGCSVVTREQLLEGKWVDRGAEVMCGWEGEAWPLEAGATRAEDVRFSEPGRWRIALLYGIDCDPKKPLSEQNCKSMGRAYSAPVDVAVTAKDCQRLEQDYQKALDKARNCASDITMPQCTKLVQSGLSCGCSTYVNNDNALRALSTRWAAWGCGALAPPCGVKCGPAVPSACLEDRCTPMGD